MSSNKSTAEGSQHDKCTYLDSICHTQSGSVVVGASSLTYRYWTGKVLYYDKIDQVETDVIKKQPSCEALTDCSISNVRCFSQIDRFISTHDSGNVSLWAVDEKSKLSMLVSEDEHDGMVTSLSVCHDDSKFISAGSDCSVKLWDSESFLTLSTYNAHMDGVTGSSFHPKNDNLFLTCSEDCKIFFWDLRNPKPVTLMGDLKLQSPTCLSWLPNDEDHFLVGTKTGDLLIMDLKSMSIAKSIKCCNRSITSVLFSPLRPSILAVASHDTSVTICNVENLWDIKTLLKDYSHSKEVQGISWYPLNNALLSCSWDGFIRSHTSL